MLFYWLQFSILGQSLHRVHADSAISVWNLAEYMGECKDLQNTPKIIKIHIKKVEFFKYHYKHINSSPNLMILGSFIKVYITGLIMLKNVKFGKELMYYDNIQNVYFFDMYFKD